MSSVPTSLNACSGMAVTGTLAQQLDTSIPVYNVMQSEEVAHIFSLVKRYKDNIKNNNIQITRYTAELERLRNDNKESEIALEAHTLMQEKLLKVELQRQHKVTSV